MALFDTKTPCVESPKMTKFGVDVDADESISGTVNSHSKSTALVHSL